jgi:hypothetical protein
MWVQLRVTVQNKAFSPEFLTVTFPFLALLWIRVRIRPDPDFDQIRIRSQRILALINDPISTFLVCVKAMNTVGIPVV